MTLTTRLSAVWFAVAVALTTATQLRAGSVPLGPGEALLMGWLLFSAGRVLLAGGFRFEPAGMPVVLFWLVSVTLLFAGWAFNAVFRISVQGSAFHDIAALVFSAVTVCAFVLQPQLAERALVAARTFVPVTVLPVFALLVLGLLGVGGGPLTVWYMGFYGRFQGWAENPNQVALMIVPIPLLALFLLGRAESRMGRWFWVGITLLSAIIGFYTFSDSVALAWVGCLGLLAVRAWWNLARNPTRSYLRLWTAYVAAPLAALAVVALFAGRALAVAERVAFAVWASGGQGSERVRIWTHGMQAIAASPLVGLGPGAHSGKHGPFQGLEVHNTFIDWGTSTGMLGMAAYVALLVWAARRALRSGEFTLFLALGAFAAFSTFHYVLRHPTFWFALTVAAFAGEAARVPARQALARRRPAEGGAGGGGVPLRPGPEPSPAA